MDDIVSTVDDFTNQFEQLKEQLKTSIIQQEDSQTKWDRRFVELARFISAWSKDPSTKTGAVIVDSDRRIISVGYNGLPKGVKDTDERLNDRDTKYKIILHAETNAATFAPKMLEGCTLYTWPIMSCTRCASLMIQHGIKRCVAPKHSGARWKGDWIADLDLSKQLFDEAGVELVLLDGCFEDN